MQVGIVTLTLQPDKPLKPIGNGCRIVEVLERIAPTSLLPAWQITALIEYAEVRKSS